MSKQCRNEWSKKYTSTNIKIKLIMKYRMMFENIRASKKISLYQLPRILDSINAPREENIVTTLPPRFIRKRGNVLHVGQEVVSVAVNEALIPYSLLFPCHLFLFRCSLGMRSSGMADGPRPFVTTINHPDAIFAGADGKTSRSSDYVRAHTRASRIRTCCTSGSSRCANAFRIFRISRDRLARWSAVFGDRVRIT